MVGDLLLAVDSQPDLLTLNLKHASIDVLFDLAQADLELVDWSKAVTFQSEPGLPVALVDPTRLVRALGHLIRCVAECALPGEAIQVKACRRQGGPAIVIGTVNPVPPGRADPRGNKPLLCIRMTARPEALWLRTFARLFLEICLMPTV